MLAAFFIVTDPVSSATTPRGMLIFGAGAVEATVSGLGGDARLSMLAAILVGSLVLAPLAASAALRISVE